MERLTSNRLALLERGKFTTLIVATRKIMQVNQKELASGAVFIAVGLFYGSITVRTLVIGSALDIGPGYFPFILSGVLIVLGAVIAVRGFWVGHQTPFGVVPWRGIIMLSLATIVFAAFFDDLGMLPGVFVTTLLATLASSQIHFLRATFTSLCIAFFCTAVFGYGVHLPVPIIGPAFGN